MTTNCIIPIKKRNYQNRIFTTSMSEYPNMAYIPDRPENGAKDLSKIIELAKKCESPTEIETGKIVAGFAHNQVLALADKGKERAKNF